MKRDAVLAALEGAVLGFLLGMGCTVCLVSAFHLEPLTDFSGAALLCAAAAILGAVCFSLPRGGGILLGLLAVLGGYLWQDGSLVRQAETLVYRISDFYNRAYGLGVAYWSQEPPTGTDITLVIGLWAGLTALLTARTLCRRTRAVLPVLAAVLPLALCAVVTDTPPAAEGLGVVLAVLTVLLLSQWVRRRDRRQGIRLTALLLLPSLLLTLGLLWVAPRQEALGPTAQGIADFLTDTGQTALRLALNGDLSWGVGSAGGEVNLTGLGPMRGVELPVLELETDRPGTLYLRSRDYDLYEDGRWRSSPDRRERFSLPRNLLTEGGVLRVTTRGPWKGRLLPYYPDGGAALTGGIAPNDAREESYTLPYAVLRSDYDAEIPGGGEPLSGEAYLTLPESTARWARAFLEERIPAYRYAGDSRAQARAIADYVRGSAKYDLNTGKMPANREDFVRWFLEESDTGYCVHFAAAAAVLLRAAGIPSRYVEGYLVTVPESGTVTVALADAHAWVEYYLDGVGWLPLEPTPSAGSQPSVPAPRATEPAVSVSVPAPTAAPTAPGVPPQTSPSGGSREDGNPAAPAGKAAFPWTAAILPAGLGLLLLLWQVRVRLSRRRRSGPNATALAWWRAGLRMARSLGEPPSRQAEALALRARFSPHTLTRQELEEMERWLRELESRLRARALPRRLLDRLILALY